VWALAALCWLRLWIHTLAYLRRTPALVYSVNLVTIQGYVAIPLMEATVLLRLASNERVAVTLPVSLMFSAALILVSACGGYIYYAVFETLFRGTVDFDRKNGARQVRRSFAAFAIGNVVFAVVMVATTVLPIYTEQGPSPFAVTCLIVRNVTIMLYYGSYLALHISQIRSARVIIASISQDHPAVAQVRAKLDYLEAVGRASIKTVFVLLLVYCVFTAAPQLYVFMYVPTALLVALSSGSGNPVNVFLASPIAPHSVVSPAASKSSANGDGRTGTVMMLRKVKDTSVLVMRRGEPEFTHVEDSSRLDEEIEGGEVMADDGTVRFLLIPQAGK